MRLKNEVKVGIIVTSAIIVLISIYWFLGGLSLRASTYPIYAVFPNAQRLEKGSLVRMAGVKVGYVQKTRLTVDNDARVDLRIDETTRIPVDSVAKATTGAFIGEFYIEIRPGKSAKTLQRGDRVAIETLAQPDEILEQVADILKELRTSVTSANDLLGDREMVASLKASVKAMRQAAESAADVAASAEVLINNASPAIAKMVKNLEDATAGAKRATDQVEDMIETDVRPDVQAALDVASTAAGRLDTAVRQAQEIISGFRDTPGKVNQSVDTLGATFDEARTAVKNLKDASLGVKSLTTDAQLQEDVKTAVHNAAMASQQLKELTESLNAKYGRSRARADERGSIPDAGLVTNALWNTDSGDYRLDTNYTLAWTADRFYRLGAFSAGEDTKLNLQAGLARGSTALRYGLYASRLAVGFDQKLGSCFTLSGDVFRPNRPEMELRGVLSSGGSLGLYGGVYDLFHGSSRDLFLGVQYNSR